MKAAPVVRTLGKFPEIEQILIHSGQHYDANMSDVFFHQLDLPAPNTASVTSKNNGRAQPFQNSAFQCFQQLHLTHSTRSLTIQNAGGDQVSYDPKRLSGVSVYRETEREFSVGERIQFTAPNKQLGVANRELGIIEKIDVDSNVAVRLEDGRTVQFNDRASAF
jgi:urease beta subunit